METEQPTISKDLLKSSGPLKLINYLLSRHWGIRFVLFAGKLLHGKKIKGLHNEERYIKSRNSGPDIRIRIYRPENQEGKLPALLYCHGGGYMIGCPEEYSAMIESFIQKRPCVIVAPDYRKAPRFPYPSAFNDCYDTLLWMKESAASLNILENKFIIAGHSAGGGLTAALTLKARDTGDVDIAFQMPIYPMIDDRQTSVSSQFIDTPIWNARTNAFGWDCYLKDIRAQKAEVPAYAAPARNSDYSNFPPTITFVGTAEPFRDETIQYAEALKEAKIPLEFMLFEGCFHGFDVFAPKSPPGRAALDFTFESYSKYYDQYCSEADR